MAGLTDQYGAPLGTVGNPLYTYNTVSGAPASLSNPYPGADQIRLWIQNGQGFTATTGKLTSPASANQTLPFVLFSPAESAKTVLIYSIKCSTSGGANTQQITSITSDPVFTALPAANITNLKFGAATTSVASLEYNNTASQSVVGNPFDVAGLQSNTPCEFLDNGAVIVLPAGAASVAGIAVWMFVGTASTIWNVVARWIEY